MCTTTYRWPLYCQVLLGAVVIISALWRSSLTLALGSVTINRQGAHTRNSAQGVDQSVLIGEEGDQVTGDETDWWNNARHQTFAGGIADGWKG